MSQKHQYGPSYIQLNAPNEWRDTGADATFNDSLSESSLNTNLFTWSGQAAAFMMNWKNTSGFGTFNGIPYRVIFVSEKVPTNQYTIFDGYIDLASEDCFIDSTSNPTIFRAPIVRITNSKSVIEQMAVITQGLLLKKNAINYLDFVDIPFIIESKKNARERAADLFAFGTQVSTSLTQIGSNILGALANIPTLGLPIAVVELALVFVNAVTVINRLVDQGLAMKDLFFPTVRYYKGFNVAHMIRKAFAYKGYTVDFGVLEGELSKCYLLPSQNDFDGFPVPGLPFTGICKPQDFGYTIMELIEGLTKQRNLRGDVRNGVVHLKRRNDPFWTASPSFTAENALIKNTELYSNGLFKDDTARVKSTFAMYYTYDSTDCHTLTEKNGDSVEVHRDLINEVDPKMNTLKGLDEFVIPWALCVRKKPFDNLWDLFTGINGEFDTFLQQVKDMIQQFNADLSASGVDVASEIDEILTASGFGSLLENRTGVLKIDDNTFAIPKFVYMTPAETKDGVDRIPENFKDFVGCPALYNTGYLSESPAIQNNFMGQYRLVKDLKLPWSYEKSQLTDDNPAFTINGFNCKFQFLNWNEPKHEAIVDFEQNQPFDTNITEETI